MIYKSFLCERSGFFSAVLQGESDIKPTRLLETEPEVFEVYAGWIYTACVGVTSIRCDDGTSTARAYDEIKDTEQTEVFNNLAKCYALGDLLQDVGFQNTVIDEFITYFEAIYEVAPTDTIQLICATVPMTSTLVKLCADHTSADLEAAEFDELVRDYPPNFVTQIARASVRDRRLGEYNRSPKNHQR